MDKQGYKPLYDESGKLLELEIGGVYEAILTSGVHDNNYFTVVTIIEKTTDSSLPYFCVLDGQYQRYLCDDEHIGKQVGYDARYSDEYKRAQDYLTDTREQMESLEIFMKFAEAHSQLAELEVDEKLIVSYIEKLTAYANYLEGCMQAIVDAKSKMFEEDTTDE